MRVNRLSCNESTHVIRGHWVSHVKSVEVVLDLLADEYGVVLECDTEV